MPCESNFSAYSERVSRLTRRVNSRLCQRSRISAVGLVLWGLRAAARSTFVSKTALNGEAIYSWPLMVWCCRLRFSKDPSQSTSCVLICRELATALAPIILASAPKRDVRSASNSASWRRNISIRAPRSGIEATRACTSAGISKVMVMQSV